MRLKWDQKHEHSIVILVSALRGYISSSKGPITLTGRGGWSPCCQLLKGSLKNIWAETRAPRTQLSYTASKRETWLFSGFQLRKGIWLKHLSSSAVLGWGIEPGRFGSSLRRRTPLSQNFSSVGAGWNKQTLEFTIPDGKDRHSWILSFFHPLPRAGNERQDPFPELPQLDFASCCTCSSFSLLISQRRYFDHQQR